MLEELYSNAYLYILPSDLEGMPLSLLEAMSYGNCCIVSDIPECTEVVGNKAFIVARGNVKELGNCIQALINDEEAVNAYKSEASHYVCEKYDWDKVTNETIEKYR